VCYMPRPSHMLPTIQFKILKFSHLFFSIIAVERHVTCCCKDETHRSNIALFCMSGRPGLSMGKLCVFETRRLGRVFGAQRWHIITEGKRMDKLSSFIIHILHQILLWWSN
jgi:hypothetical protein